MEAVRVGHALCFQLYQYYYIAIRALGLSLGSHFLPPVFYLKYYSVSARVSTIVRHLLVYYINMLHFVLMEDESLK